MPKVVLFALVFLGAAWPGDSQLLSWGVEGGVPLNNAVNAVSNGISLQGSVPASGSFNTVTNSTSSVTTNTDRWTVGPTVQLHLPFRFSIEVDALYRSEGYTIASGANASKSNSITNWQFPFLAKYDLHGGVVRPFVDAGVTYRHLSGDGIITNPNGAGFTIGGGLTLKLLFLRLSPEIRYTRWNKSNILNSTYATQSQNQADFLVGFTF